ncbi:repair protein Rad1/Rec1/Rad17-domain-containing protein [Pisolithus croceorrhizus]|nr:repair protein Rad1/Rec1/Rad17-domain-containing protein [Pisolithus croceorrhizus]
MSQSQESRRRNQNLYSRPSCLKLRRARTLFHYMQVLTASRQRCEIHCRPSQRHQLSNRASVTLSADLGIIVTVEEARTLLATSYIYSDHFDEWNYSAEISGPAQCLNIYGTAGMSAAGGNSSHKKWRREGDRSDDERYGETEMEGNRRGVQIVTFDPEPFIELPFDGDRTVLKIIFKVWFILHWSVLAAHCDPVTTRQSSSWLRDALSELDPSCDKITFISNPVAEVRKAHRGMPAKPLFRIIATGAFGTTEMDYPNDREVLETFECFRPMRASYNFAQVARTLRALQSSTKTSLRIDDEGLLSLQFLVPVPKPRAGLSDSFIEFRCLALDEEIAS